MRKMGNMWSSIGPRARRSAGPPWWQMASLYLASVCVLVNAFNCDEALAVIERGARLEEGVLTSSGRSWGVVIGINDYQLAPRLSYAVADARALAHVLRRLNFDVREFYDEDATRASLYRELFEELANRVSENDRVLIFFAGHGETKPLRHGKQIGYLLPSDGNLATLAETGLSMSAIRDLADTLPAKHVLFIIDACYGGVAGQRFRGIPKVTEHYLREVTRERGRQLITAGGGDQRALEGPEWGHSVFTYYLLEGLEHGLADLNEDGIIPASELYQYLDQRVFNAAAMKGHAQRPELWVMAAERGEFVFVSPVKPSTGNSFATNVITKGAVQSSTISSDAIQVTSSATEAEIHNPDPKPGLEKPRFATATLNGTRLSHPEVYFPRTVGNRWNYRGELTDNSTEKPTKRYYNNMVTIQPMERLDGEWVKVTVESNPGYRGRTVTYTQEDETGILVKGWKPIDPLFREVFPYYAIRYPLEIPSTSLQFQREGGSSSKDYDGDGKTEQVDLVGEIRIMNKEAIRVPAGNYSDALRIDFVVTINVHMTKTGQQTTITSSGSRWYAEHVGLVKEVKQTAGPAVAGGRPVSLISAVEELESVHIVP